MVWYKHIHGYNPPEELLPNHVVQTSVIDKKRNFLTTQEMVRVDSVLWGAVHEFEVMGILKDGKWYIGETKSGIKDVVAKYCEESDLFYREDGMAFRFINWTPVKPGITRHVELSRPHTMTCIAWISIDTEDDCDCMLRTDNRQFFSTFGKTMTHEWSWFLWVDLDEMSEKRRPKILAKYRKSMDTAVKEWFQDD